MSQKIYWLILVVLVVVGGWYVLRGVKSVKTVNPVFTVTSDGKPSFTVTMKTFFEKGDNEQYVIEVQYPVVSGLSNTDANDLINKTLYETVMHGIDSFKQDAMGNAYSNKDEQSSLSVVVASTTPRSIPIISFTLASQFYSAGAAHPGTQISSFNFDPLTGKALTLPDMFVGDYLTVFSDYSRNALEKQLGADSESIQIQAGTVATLDSFEVFVPEDDGVHVIFNEYQVASYSAGPQEIVIPYSELKKVINPKGPLKDLR